MSGWDELKAQGTAAYKLDDFAGALSLYTRALADASLPPPERATLLNNRAQCHLKLEDWGSAVADATSALTLDPTNVKALFRRCVPGGKGACADGVLCAPSHPHPHTSSGSAYEGLRDPQQALADYQAVLALSPGQTDARAAVKRLTAASSVAAAEGERNLREVLGAARSRRRVVEQVKRAVELTHDQVAMQAPETTVYRPVGRMYLGTPAATLLVELKQKLDTVSREFTQANNAVDTCLSRLGLAA